MGNDTKMMEQIIGLKLQMQEVKEMERGENKWWKKSLSRIQKCLKNGETSFFFLQ